MNEIFSIYHPLLIAPPGLLERKTTPLAASGATLIFSSTLYPQEPPSLFMAMLATFWENLQTDPTFFDASPSPSPWTQLRQLKVPKLPYPAFRTSPRRRLAVPQGYDPYPLIPDTKEEEPRAMPDFATTEGHRGILRERSDGMICLEVSPEKIIPVILPHEREERPGFSAIAELGEEFIFSMSGPYLVQPVAWPEVDEVCFYSVLSPALLELRAKYLHPGNRGFHLILSTKRRRHPSRPRPEVFRINVCCHAA